MGGSVHNGRQKIKTKTKMKTESTTPPTATVKTDTTFFYKATFAEFPISGLIVGHGADEIEMMTDAAEKLHAKQYLNAELFFRFPYDPTVGMQ